MQSCLDNPVSDELSDAEKLAALEGVNWSPDTLYQEIHTPAPIEGKSYDTLVAENPAFADPANYTISITFQMEADNKTRGTGDAQFNGINIETVFDTITSTPVEMSTGTVTIPLDSIVKVPASTSINLATHKEVGRYIFQRTVDGADLATNSTASYHYEIGRLTGDLPLLSAQQDIPTRATPEMKNFLSGLLASGMLD
jgi:hypothetical protein